MTLVCNVAPFVDSLDNVLTFLRKVVLFASCSGDGMTFLDRFTGCDDDVIAFLGSVAVFAGWLEDVLNALNALSCDTVRFVDETAAVFTYCFGCCNLDFCIGDVISVDIV